MIAKTLWASVAVMLVAFTNAEYDVAKYCQLVKTSTQLPSMDACSTYYICGPGGQPIKANCTAGSVFSKDAQECVADSNNNCYFGLDNPCANKNGQFAPSAKACNQWHFCENGNIANSGSCRTGEIYSASSATCVYGQCKSGDKIDGLTAVQNVCQIMPDGQFFGDNEQCNAWHKCKSMLKQDGVCEGQLVYDAKSGQCLKNDGNMCDRTGGIGINTPGGKPLTECSAATAVKLVGDKQVCSVYYSCQLVATATTPNTYTWVQMQCNNNQYFDVISNTCSSISQARPYIGCNRCEFTTGYTYWVNIAEPTCASYNTCRNGQMLSNGQNKCPVGYYFSEPAQFCVASNFNQYVQGHGACQAYTCSDAGVCTETTSPVTPSPGNSTLNTPSKTP